MNMDSEIARAKAAAKRTDIDRMVWIGGAIGKAKVDPRSIDILNEKADLKDRILLRVPDLLDMAIYAWYRLQEEAAAE